MVWKTLFSTLVLPYCLKTGKEKLEKGVRKNSPGLLIKVLACPQGDSVKRNEQMCRRDIPRQASQLYHPLQVCSWSVRRPGSEGPLSILALFLPSWLHKSKRVNPYILIPKLDVSHAMSFVLPRNDHIDYQQSWAILPSKKFYSSLTRIAPQIKNCSQRAYFTASPLPHASENCVSCYIKELLKLLFLIWLFF